MGGVYARTLHAVTTFATGLRGDDFELSESVEVLLAATRGPLTCLVHDPPLYFQPSEATLLVKSPQSTLSQVDSGFVQLPCNAVCRRLTLQLHCFCFPPNLQKFRLRVDTVLT